MAWRRRAGGRKAGKDAPPPPAPTPGPVEMEVLPSLPDEGTTTDREAYKRLKRSDADLKRLDRKEQKARKARDRRARKIDQRLARIERSRQLRPIQLIANLLVLNGIAAVVAVLKLHWPDFEMWPPLLYAESVHWETVALCFVGAAAVTSLLLVYHPSLEYQRRARSALQVYFSTALVLTFVGGLIGIVLEPMEGMDFDWPTILWVLLVVLAVSGISLTFIRSTARYGGSRSFLTGRYHLVMGVLMAAFVVSLVLLPIFFLALQGWMLDVGLTMLVVGGLGMIFPLPALWGTFAVEWHMGRLSRAWRT